MVLFSQDTFNHKQKNVKKGGDGYLKPAEKRKTKRKTKKIAKKKTIKKRSSAIEKKGKSTVVPIRKTPKNNKIIFVEDLFEL